MTPTKLLKKNKNLLKEIQENHLNCISSIVEFDYLTVVATIAVNEELWKKELV